MEAKSITIIPRKSSIRIDSDTGLKKKKRVCAYARVSTDLDDQKNSFEAQLNEYETRIKSNPEWIFTKLYSDEGISGTSIKNRKGFLEMINDALNGQIDLILTKSISRFARNTIDCLKTVRDLNSHGVIVQFEKENITTEDPKIEMMLTIFASMAQEESKSISENVKWGVRNRMKRGVVHYYKNILGYDKLSDGSIVVNNEEKELVLKIFNLYIAGYSARQIASYLNEKQYKTGTGKSEWSVSYIFNILSNEKYCGDVLLQKTVCRDFLTHKREKNTGLEKQYLISNNHEPIITRAMFEYVQNIKSQRSKNCKEFIRENYTPVAGIMICENCLRNIRMVRTHPNTKYETKIITCKSVSKKSTKYKQCDSSPLNYELALLAISDAYSKVVTKNKMIDKLILQSLKIDDGLLDSYITQHDKLSTEIKNLQIALDRLIENQIDSPSASYENDYLLLKNKIKEANIKLQNFKTQSYQENNKTIREYQIIRYLNDEKDLNPNIVQSVFFRIIKRIDNSLRFICCDSNYSQDEIDKLLPIWLNEKPSISSIVSNDKGTLKYDIVYYGGNHNE